MKKILMIAACLLLSAVLMIGCGEEEIDYDHPVANVTSSYLLKAFDKNGVKAEQDYKDQVIQVTGTVDNIDVDILDDAYITLKGGKEFSLISVQCYFDESETDKLAELKSGKQVTVVGVCKGSSLNVILKKCKLK